jgi:hypothetical protein
MPIYYTYLWLREDGTPYYVGKGHGQRAFRKGCPSKDQILIQEFPSEEDSFTAEIFLISYYGRVDLGTGCLRNLTDGGDGILRASAEVREKIRKSKLGNNYALGLVRGPQSAEHRQKLSLSHTGLKRSVEALKKFRSSMIGHTVSQETRDKIGRAHKGRKASEETRARLRASHLGKSLPMEQRKKISAALAGRPWSADRRAMRTRIPNV